MNETRIKISELESASELDNNLLNNAEVPIAIQLSNDEIGNNYKLKLSDHYYNKTYIDSKFKSLQDFINNKFSGINTSEVEDNSTLIYSLKTLSEHISRLQHGALNSDIAHEDSNKIGYPEIYNFENVLYKPLKSSKILISNSSGKITTSFVDADKLQILKDWNYTKEIIEAGVVTTQTVTLYEKIQELENKIKEIESTLAVLNNGPYYGPSYSEKPIELSMDNKVYIAEKDGILSVIPYYSHSAGRFDIYINDKFITQSYQCYGDGHSHSGCCIPIKRNDKIKFVKTGGKQANQKAYLIY